MAVVDGIRAAAACSAWARPISPPSLATALLSAMFWALNGATSMPRSTSSRQRAATRVVLPASLPVPATSTAGP